MNVVVGIVYQRRSAPVPEALSRGVEVITHVNADARHGGSPWAGFGANQNRLMQRATSADWYVAMNPDVTASAETIQELVSEAERGGFMVAAPLYRSPWGQAGLPRDSPPGPRRWLTETVRGASNGNGQRSPETAGALPSTWVNGACMAIRVGSCPIRFDERYFMYFEDVDLCARVIALGGKVGVCADIVVDHESGWSESDPLRWRRGVEFARSALRFAETTGHAAPAMRLAGLARYGSRCALLGRAEPERVASQAITRGFLLSGSGPGLAELAEEHNRSLG